MEFRPISGEHVESLATEACFELLRAQHVGSVAVTDGALPVVIPVAYGLPEQRPEDRIVLQAPLLEVLRRSSGGVAALGAHAFDSALGSGWSVSVVGVMHTLAGPAAKAAARSIGLDGDVEPPRLVLEMSAGHIVGWRFTGR